MTNAHLDSNGEYRFVFAGGSYATITTIKFLGTEIIPKFIEKNKNIKRIKVTVIAPNREAYWNVAAVRVISDPDLLDTNARQLFFSLESTLSQYFPPDGLCKLELIQGKVISVDAAKNKLSYIKMNDEGLIEGFAHFLGQSLMYDRLILATGASSSSPAFKLNASAFISKRSLRNLHDSVHNSRSIAIIGAGGVGVELAGELGYKYGKTKSITLYSDINGALDSLKPKIAFHAIKQLEDLHVKVVTNTRVVGIQKDEGYSTKIDGTTDLVHRHENSALQDVFDEKSNNVQTEPEKPEYPHRPFSHRLKIKPYRSLTKHTSHNSSVSGLSDSDASEVSRDTEISNSSTLYSVESTQNNNDSKYLGPKTIISFADGSRTVVDCCIPATGNIPNTSFLPHDALDDDGYILVDPYLRMLHQNPQKNIYVVGDIVSGGRETINDITTSQRQTLRTTLYHDLIDITTPLKEYVISPPLYLVAISKNGGVGTLNGLPVPSFVVTWMKAKHFRMDESRKFLE